MAIGLQKCPDDKCVDDLRQCNKTCEAFPRLEMCPSGSCVEYLGECGRPECPDDKPKRCSDMSCINQQVDSCCDMNTHFRCSLDGGCYSQDESDKCTIGGLKCSQHEYFCQNNGKCVVDPDHCFLPECSDAEVRCPDGSCKIRGTQDSISCMCQGNSSQIFCPNLEKCIFGENYQDCYSSCQPGFRKCPNSGRCVEDLIDCYNTTKVCPPGLNLCHDSRRCVDEQNKCSIEKCPHLCENTLECAYYLDSCCPENTELCHYGEKKGKCIEIENYEAFCDLPQICPPMTPYKCANETCVSSIDQCLCPTISPIKCSSDGRCVTESKHCLDALCDGKYMCSDYTCVDDKTECKSNSVLCPPGYKICPNGIDCISGEKDITLCPSTVECIPPRSILCKSTKQCVSHGSLCPSFSCNEGFHLCWNMQCVKNISLCERKKEECGFDEVVCPYGGECKSNIDLCPIPPVCSDKEKLCTGEFCVPKDEECPELEPECEGYVCPDTKKCVEKRGNCPTGYFIPHGFAICQDGSMISDSSFCKIINCISQGLLPCPRSGECKSSLKDCPSLTTCPHHANHRCPHGECVENKDDCREFHGCPLTMKRCQNNKCVPRYQSCQKEITCPEEFSVLCDSGLCVDKVEKCPDWNCPHHFFICPDGKCVESSRMCGNTKHCDGVLCWDKSCRKTRDECSTRPSVECNNYEFPYLCPEVMSCRKSVKDCGTRKRCPRKYPIFCNGRCVKNEKKCKDFEEIICEEDEYLCSDGVSCAKTDKSTSCPSLPTCTGKFPVLCSDGTCRKRLKFCPSPKHCKKSEKICWNGDCVTSRSECPEKPLCDQENLPIMCPNFVCVAAKNECANIFSCPPSLPYLCHRNKRCMINKNACDMDAPDKCPNRLFSCPDGTCVRKEEQCRNADGCFKNKIRCKYNGKCVSSHSECEKRRRNIEEDDKCSNDYFLADDGSCWINSGEALNILPNGCPKETPKYCVASDTCIDTSETCGTTVFCPDGYERCEGGLCVDTEHFSSCPKVRHKIKVNCMNSEEGLYPCFSGDCVEEDLLCPIVFSRRNCSEHPNAGNNPLRCANGRCYPSANHCIDMDSRCPSTLDYVCENGLCATGPQDCLVSNGCTVSFPYKCENGKCVSDDSYCNLDGDILANGCTRIKPVKCEFSKSCVISEDMCVNDASCPLNKPHRCDDTGVCVEYPNDCIGQQTCSEIGGFKCPTGDCVLEKSMCVTKTRCPIHSPIRCKNGECMRNWRECASSTECADKIFNKYRCAVGLCVEDYEMCPPTTPCNGFICKNGECKTSKADCFDMCPHGKRIKCPSTGACVSDIRECEDPYKKCDDGYYYCALDDECHDSPRSCIKEFVDDLETGIMCFDGSIATSYKDCPRMHYCPPGRPFRCKSGKCMLEKDDCGTPPTCTSPKKLCSDGICREECIKNDCVNLLCPNLICVESIDLCDTCEVDGKIGYKCWDGGCFETFAECKRPTRIKRFEISLSQDDSNIQLFSSEGDGEEPIIDIDIPPYAIPTIGPNGKLTIESDDAIDLFTNLRDNDHIICSTLIKFNVLDENGDVVDEDIVLNKDVTLKFVLLCENEELDESFSLIFVKKNGEMFVEGKMDENVEEGSYDYGVEHFSTFGVIIPFGSRIWVIVLSIIIPVTVVTLICICIGCFITCIFYRRRNKKLNKVGDVSTASLKEEELKDDEP